MYGQNERTSLQSCEFGPIQWHKAVESEHPRPSSWHSVCLSSMPRAGNDTIHYPSSPRPQRHVGRQVDGHMVRQLHFVISRLQSVKGTNETKSQSRRVLYYSGLYPAMLLADNCYVPIARPDWLHFPGLILMTWSASPPSLRTVTHFTFITTLNSYHGSISLWGAGKMKKLFLSGKVRANLSENWELGRRVPR